MPNANHPSERPGPEVAASLRSYWRKNLLLMGVLLIVWAFAGLGCGILFADTLNEYKLPGTGYPLGFWFAHQGAIVIFVLIILVYALCMNRIDRVHREELVSLKQKGDAR